MPKRETVHQTITIGQMKELAAALVESIPVRLYANEAQYWIGHKRELAALLDQHLRVGLPWSLLHRAGMHLELDVDETRPELQELDRARYTSCYRTLTSSVLAPRRPLRGLSKVSFSFIESTGRVQVTDVLDLIRQFPELELPSWGQAETFFEALRGKRLGILQERLEKRTVVALCESESFPDIPTLECFRDEYEATFASPSTVWSEPKYILVNVGRVVGMMA